MIAAVADVDIAGGGRRSGAVDGDESGGLEAAGGRGGGSRLAGFRSGADVAVGGGIDFVAEHEEEFAAGAELLDAVGGGVGDVEVAGGGAGGVIDGDVGGVGEGVGAGAGDGRSKRWPTTWARAEVEERVRKEQAVRGRGRGGGQAGRGIYPRQRRSATGSAGRARSAVVLVGVGHMLVAGRRLWVSIRLVTQPPRDGIDRPGEASETR